MHKVPVSSTERGSQWPKKWPARLTQVPYWLANSEVGVYGKLKKRCKLEAVVAEADRILRPVGKLIVRDTAEIINELESMAKSMQWEVRTTFSKKQERFLCVQKSMWRPKELETLEYAIGEMLTSRVR